MIKKVRVSILIEVDDNRGIDLTNPNTYNLVMLSRDGLIFDIDLKRKGEDAYKPRVRIEN